VNLGPDVFTDALVFLSRAACLFNERVNGRSRSPFPETILM
jgi:hypothetical protein